MVKDNYWFFSSLNSETEDLEAQKRREYEEWFKAQEKEAMEYSACVKYQEKSDEKVESLIDVSDSLTETKLTSNHQLENNSGSCPYLPPFLFIQISNKN